MCVIVLIIFKFKFVSVFSIGTFKVLFNVRERTVESSLEKLGQLIVDDIASTLEGHSCASGASHLRRCRLVIGE